MNGASSSTITLPQTQTKQSKPQVSIQLLKQTVKKFKSQGFESLTHHQLAVALSTVGFAEVCKQFGAIWNIKHDKQALKILQNSDYDLSWYGKTNNIRYSSFVVLCSRGDIQKIKQLMATLNLQNKKQLFATVDNFKRNGLHIAVKQGFDILVQYLINQGMALNSRDRQLKTPLHYCKNQLICQVLINKGAKVIVKDNKMCTPVHYIAGGADYKCLQILLKAANVVNQKDATGKTALFYAIFNTSEEQVNIIRVLIQNGAKVNQQDMLGRTPLHYASQIGKSRCIPILLRKGASIDAKDKHGKSPLDLAEGQQKVRKILLAYCTDKGVIFQEEEESKRKQFKAIQENNENIINQSVVGKQKDNRTSKLKNSSKIKQSTVNKETHGQSQVYARQSNQISTWVRQKFFVLMKKLQQSGVKAMWHLKRPYVYTGSWAQDVDSLQDLYDTFLNVSGPEAAMRTFNLLCPYQKSLPTVIGKSEQAFQSFFGQSWFSNDPIQKLRNIHSSSKVRTELEIKIKQADDLKTQLTGYRSQIQALQSKIMNLNQQISHYKKVQDDLRKQKSKNITQYTQILKLTSQNQQLKSELNNLVGGQQNNKILNNLVEQLRNKNSNLLKQIQTIRLIQAAARRKCGQIFLKGLSLSQGSSQFNIPNQQNLYDDDAIVSLYNLLKGNPPNLQKRFKIADKRGNNKLSIDQFTRMLEDLSMLPQDVMSMHRITGFAFGRKTLSLQQFKTILQNRHKNRPMWQKKLIRKIKTIILENGIKIDKFFELMDTNGNGSIQASQLRKGLEQYNIFMNQTDWSNLFNLLDSDNSGEIDLNQLKTLMEQERTGKLESIQKPNVQPNNQKSDDKEQDNIIKAQKQKQDQDQDDKINDQQQQNKKENQQNNSQNNNESEQNQFPQPYKQKDSDQQKGIVKLNGSLKLKVPALKLGNIQGQQNLQKIYVKFYVNDDVDFQDSIKMADLSKKKLQIKTELKLVQYKVQDMQNFKINISVWKSRQSAAQQDYLGQIDINLKDVIDRPGQISIDQKFKLGAQIFQKQVKANIYVQAQWVPTQQEQ